GVEHEIVRKSGAWYTYDGDQLGQGKENSRNFLLENPKIAAEIEQKIMLKLGIGAEAKAAQTKAAADAIVAEAEQVKAAGTKASGPVLAVATADEPGLPSAVGE
ncbi:MAG TPA: DNA recombination/repair protein RecA, partial [Rhodoglobus sp.]|nr:DNA recombination/repair protein RecA [Rhodoglobus sp.]